MNSRLLPSPRSPTTPCGTTPALSHCSGARITVSAPSTTYRYRRYPTKASALNRRWNITRSLAIRKSGMEPNTSIAITLNDRELPTNTNSESKPGILPTALPMATPQCKPPATRGRTTSRWWCSVSSPLINIKINFNSNQGIGRGTRLIISGPLLLQEQCRYLKSTTPNLFTSRLLPRVGSRRAKRRTWCHLASNR